MGMFQMMGKTALLRAVRTAAYSLGKCVYSVYLRFYAFRLRKIAKRKVSESQKGNKPLRVAFMLYDLPFWKNEPLFESMLADERFLPAFWILHYPFAKSDEDRQVLRERCLEYVRRKSYLYFEDCSLAELRTQFAPDYVFVVHPYDNHIPFDISELKTELPCFIPYGYSNMDTPRVYNGKKLRRFYRYYVESSYIQNVARRYMFTRACNTRNTGLPMADWLMAAKPVKTDVRKCVIWASHWTIKNDCGGALGVSSFLHVAEKMVELVHKFRHQVIFVFKPHPLLKRELYETEGWGKERTDSYFSFWSNGENTRLAEGEYVELFAQSDAMIHDCGSFIQEYLLMNKPCMYIEKPGAKHLFNSTTLQALECYQKGSCIEEIDHFVQGVLNGQDPLADKRESFLNSYLRPNGGFASKNIISDLLNP